MILGLPRRELASISNLAEYIHAKGRARHAELAGSYIRVYSMAARFLGLSTAGICAATDMLERCNDFCGLNITKRTGNEAVPQVLGFGWKQREKAVNRQ